jgi:putative aldouronate transport system permease protein
VKSPLADIYKKARVAIMYFVMASFMIICIYPFYYVLIYSISDPFRAAGGITVLPAGLNFDTYRRILTRKDILNAIFISVSRVVIGVSLVVLCSSFFAFIICQKKLPMRKSLYRLCVISMYLNAGLIPWYLTMKAYGLKDNFLLYILPYMIGPFFVILTKTYVESLSPALEESAKIDGAGYFRVFFSIIFPICLPVVATVAVFSAVGHWNYWVDNFFLVDKSNLQTLQMKLYQYLMQAEAIAKSSRQANAMSQNIVKITPQTVKMCVSIITTLPILIVYPFLQRYFAGGILLGAIKG